MYRHSNSVGECAASAFFRGIGMPSATLTCWVQINVRGQGGTPMTNPLTQPMTRDEKIDAMLDKHEITELL